MDDVDPSLEWVRIDVGFLDNPSLDVLLKYVARYSTYRPAFIGLVGSLSRNAVLDGRPEIHAILNNTLPCYILNRRPKDLDYIPSSAISVYNRFGTETFYLRVNGRNLDVLENPERREFLTDKDPADEVELDLAELDSEFSRLLIFVFTLSHTVMWFHSDTVFSNYYLRLLKIVDLARLKGLPIIGKMLSKITEFKDWMREGSLCCPRLVFIFSGYPQISEASLSTAKGYDVLKAEQDTAVRLYTVLKKCRLISIPRSSGLCFLSAKKESVLFATEGTPPTQFLDIWPGAKEFQSRHSEAVAPSEFFLPPSTTAPKEKSSSIPLKIEHRSVASSFDNTLKTCVSDIMQSNSTSALVRPSGFLWPSHFYKPSLSEWFAAAIHLHSLLFHGDEFRSLLDSKLGSTMSISRKYSRSVAAFSINSFILRTTESGVRQIRNCLHSYMQFARGPAAKGFGTAMASYLAEGALYRRQCAARSLYGSRCTLTIHLTPAQQSLQTKDRKKQRLSVMFHQSRASLMSFCSCGRTAHQRPEPFDIRAANELFYESMDHKCCSLLESRVDFPSLTVNRRGKKIKEDKKPEIVTIKRYDSFPELSTAVQLNEKDISQPYISVVVQSSSEQTIKQSLAERPYMFQIGMTFDTVPRICSWVMYALGNAGRYRQDHGLEHHLQADFLNLHHHLIPLDSEIVLLQKHRLMKYQPNRPTQMQFAEASTAWRAKVYFGLDYECPKGHRFMYRSKEVSDLRRQGNDDGAQSIAEEIISHGAPLFLRCPCKTVQDNRHFVAQLMRIHVVTPRDPVQIGVLPKIRVGRAIPTFSPGVENFLILDGSTYWVLRLPFCYYDSTRKKGPFCAPRVSYPRHRKLPCSGSLLGGFLKFFESVNDAV